MFFFKSKDVHRTIVPVLQKCYDTVF